MAKYILNNYKKIENKKQTKRSERKMKKDNRKKLLLVAGISLFAILGGTLAYFTTSDTIKNIFNTAKYETKIVEDFVSPSDWTPGTTTEKNITITNNGTIDMAVRISYEEQWTDNKGNSLSLKDSENNVAAIINFNTGWTKSEDGYYYFGTKENLTKLIPNETSNSFISGVTFNQNIKATLKRTESSNGQIITYSSSGEGYDSAKYTLTVRIDTIQYDQAHNVW